MGRRGAAPRGLPPTPHVMRPICAGSLPPATPLAPTTAPPSALTAPTAVPPSALTVTPPRARTVAPRSAALWVGLIAGAVRGLACPMVQGKTKVAKGKQSILHQERTARWCRGRPRYAKGRSPLCIQKGLPDGVLSSQTQWGGCMICES